MIFQIGIAISISDEDRDRDRDRDLDFGDRGHALKRCQKKLEILSR